MARKRSKSSGDRKDKWGRTKADRRRYYNKWKKGNSRSARKLRGR